MVEESQNSKKTIKHLRRGLSIYKTGRSPFWHARIYDAVKKKYVVRSTKETTRIEAAEVAEEIVETYKKKQNSAHAVSKDRSFEHYAKMLSEIRRQKQLATSMRLASKPRSCFERRTVSSAILANMMLVRSRLAMCGTICCFLISGETSHWLCLGSQSSAVLFVRC